MTTTCLPSIVSAPEPDAPRIDEATSRIEAPRRRIARIDVFALAEQLAGDASRGRLRLQLFADRDFTFDVHYKMTSAEGLRYWRGQLPGQPDMQAHLAVSDREDATGAPFLHGLVQAGWQRYVLSSAGEGQVLIEEVDRGMLGAQDRCGFAAGADDTTDPAVLQLPSTAGGVSSEGEDALYALLGAQQAAGDLPVADIRIAMLYPPQTLAAAGSEEALKVKALLAQELVNKAFVDSHISARVTVVLQAESAIPVAEEEGEGAQSVLESAVGNEPDPVLQERIHRHLLTTNADVAALLLPACRDATGVTLVMPRPPSAIATPLSHRVLLVTLNAYPQYGHAVVETLLSENLLAHELGHLLGADHDRFTQAVRRAASEGPYDDVRGYTPQDRAFTTIMGYQAAAYGTVLVNQYSSPSLRYHGRPLGVAKDDPGNGEYVADAASFLQLSTQVVARYKGAFPASDLARSLTISVTPDLAGYARADALGPYAPGAVVRVSATPRSTDYVFGRWLLDGKPVSGSMGAATTCLVTMDTDHMVTAEFEMKHAAYTLTVDCNVPSKQSELTVTPAGVPAGQYPPGSDVTLVQAPAPQPHTNEIDYDYALLKWEVSGQSSGYQPSLGVRMMADTHVKAIFGKRVHRCLCHAVPDTEINNLAVYAFADKFFPGYTKVVADEERVNLTVTGAFECWRINGVLHKELPPNLTLYATEDLLIEACFKGWEAAAKVTIRSNLDIRPYLEWGVEPTKVHGPNAPTTENVLRTNERQTDHAFYFPIGTVLTLRVPLSESGPNRILIQAVQDVLPLTFDVEGKHVFTVTEDTDITFEYWE